MSFDGREFRNAMGLFATGVTVVTSGKAPEFHGMTANAFSSISLDPPLVLVCVDKGTHMLEILQENGAFSVNFLTADQQDTSNYFANKERPHGEKEFADIDYTVGATGMPRITGAMCVIDCLVHSVTDAGDHDVYVGEVKAMETTPDADPLLFFGGAYRTLAPKS